MYRIPRILISAGASGSGKTLFTLGLLSALKMRGKNVASFKCGPDYIDPMFHQEVVGKRSVNLDSFFVGEEEVKSRLWEHSKDCDIAIIEGVMGYYDGLAGISPRASAYDLAKITKTPTVLLVDAKGASLSLLAYIKGFLSYKEDSFIGGVIFNRMSPMLYPRMKGLVEKELGIPALGYLKENPKFTIKSRHLGLVLPEEISDLQEKIRLVGEEIEKTVDVNQILAMANQSPKFTIREDEIYKAKKKQAVSIGVAKDEAFCFLYKDNLALLEKMGANLVYFSPLRDESLPKKLDGLLLPGGYPELYAKTLSDNKAMLLSVQEAIESGMPCIAECGGFLYLHEQILDKEGNAYSMVGVIAGTSYFTGKLSRFGYVTLKGQNIFGSELGEIPAHEFHYYESENCGDAMWAQKPLSDRGWKCCHSKESLFAGFPHLYFYGNPKLAEKFYDTCIKYQEKKGKVYGDLA